MKITAIMERACKQHSGFTHKKMVLQLTRSAKTTIRNTVSIVKTALHTQSFCNSVLVNDFCAYCQALSHKKLNALDFFPKEKVQNKKKKKVWKN